MSQRWARPGDDAGHTVAGKVVAITGGARGIGLWTAQLLIRSGAVVAIGDVDAEAVAKAAANVGITGGHVDVTDRESFAAWLDEVEDRHGPIDVLINNAGIMPAGAFLDLDPAIIRRTVEIDLLGVYTGSQLAARRMAARGSGHIINIASVAGRLATPGLAVYNGVKAGVIEFSEALDAELESQGVRVSAVLPTFTRTGLISGLRTTAVVKVIEPESVARIIMKTVARPRVRVAAPRSMGWVHGNAMIPAGIKRRIRRVTGLGNSFLDYDADARAGYSRRIAQ
ncbi:SDR family NAD(P)-dependent oxidoreductase [Gordonia amarae]|uniref:SDR family NAD(P)-dependent oxidoreductase n=2 Tax=Gordonia amarae TaxID=36821 RepID=A0A857MDG3_9ACTN|nr:SDR family oxidoreductase [Gordonia amarae]MCS3879994.1 NAD(P)-dependent dehydrogenase (short-subunit alcohol dehydrogenase family) [Gordonia amarae]QHN18383.1 SDR family NAD(P)-dependent oxidoreductase [Gordonia amarae]QHN22865.1 SDR family NAD(P)-dependent oxidoreductase [Gordonia amarae]QHN31768.1 SDR family NAD(P)-dependent oxidoreductase [Gordonia amarae]QHN40514.1 SDR family NAD(P)-dependent oxidoreductase [Gordonia amarae]